MKIILSIVLVAILYAPSHPKGSISRNTVMTPYGIHNRACMNHVGKDRRRHNCYRIDPVISKSNGHIKVTNGATSKDFYRLQKVKGSAKGRQTYNMYHSY